MNNILEAEYSDWPSYVPQYLEDKTFAEDCDSELRAKIRQQADKFEFEESTGTLFRKIDDNNRALFIPFMARAELVDRRHRGTGHLGADAIYGLLRTRY